jgi:hypothetical protein
LAIFLDFPWFFGGSAIDLKGLSRLLFNRATVLLGLNPGLYGRDFLFLGILFFIQGVGSMFFVSIFGYRVILSDA